MRLLLSHPTGSQFVRQALQAFDEHGLLTEYWTTIARGESSLLDAFVPKGILAELKRRSYSPQILEKTKSRSSKEAIRLAMNRLRSSWLTKHEVGRFSVDSVYRDLDQCVARRLRCRVADAIYAYEDGALESFRVAQEEGVDRLYELPIGHWRLARIVFSEEAERWPQWAQTLEGLNDSVEKLERKDEEAHLATKIIVPSQFVAESLSDCPGVTASTYVVNYGCPAPVSSLSDSSRGPLRVLFVGSLGARKGLQYALEAVKNLDVELTLIGPRPNADCRPVNSAVEQHRYLGSIPRVQVLEEMSRHHIFLFPTLFEGLANVLLEALSQGLLPITTLNSGIGGIIRDGCEGFIVPIRDVETIRERLVQLDKDRELLESMRMAAVIKAAEHSWDRYRTNLVCKVNPSYGGN